MSLLSLVLSLRPRAPASLPSALGRAAHAALLRAIEQVNPDLAQRLHDDSGLRPFTCSSLMGSRQDKAVVPDVVYTLRYTALTAELADLLPTLFQSEIRDPRSEIRDPISEIELDGIPFSVEAVTSDSQEHPWAACVTYEELSAPWLLARQKPDARLSLRLASPTAFKSGGRAQPFPLPDLVFGSLLDKWNAYAPVALPEETRRFAAECMATSRFHLGTHAAPFKSEGVVKFGASGDVTYAALNRDRYWLSVINLLADFAIFAGLGVSTAMGMGQARRIVDVGSRIAD
jgi:CRISPR-associated endoribonuclease Cas6